VVGPPLGGAAVGLSAGDDRDRRRGQLPVSACGIAAIRGHSRVASVVDIGALGGELLDGWRHILSSPALRPVFCNRLLVGGRSWRPRPELAVLMLGPL